MYKFVLLLFLLLTLKGFSQVRFNLGLSYNNYVLANESVDRHGATLFLGVVNSFRKDIAYQINMNVRFHGSEHGESNYFLNPIGTQEYLSISLLVPFNIIYSVNKKVSLSGGVSVGYDDFILVGDTYDDLVANYNYETIRFSGDFVCIGYQGAIVFKYTRHVSTFVGFSHSFSKENNLPSLNIGVAYIF